MYFTEASSKKRASIQLVRGEQALHALDPGGIEPLEVSFDDFHAALVAGEPHREAKPDRSASVQWNRQRLLGRDSARREAVAVEADALPDGRGGHAGCTRRRERRSPHGPRACANRLATAFPRRSPRFTTRWRCTAVSRSHVPSAARRSSASSTPTTNATTARYARRAGGGWPTGRSRGCSRTTGPGRSRAWNSAIPARLKPRAPRPVGEASRSSARAVACSIESINVDL